MPSSITNINNLSAVLSVSSDKLVQISQTANHYYFSFDIFEIPKSKWRHIDVPQEPLKSIQKKIKEEILDKYKLPDSFIGGIKGGSNLVNAAKHKNSNSIMSIDIKDYFPSINEEKVISAFSDILRYPKEIAVILAKLCCYYGKLPQGASSSTSIANLVFLPIYTEIKNFISSQVIFTVFVDDLTFSANSTSHLIQPIIGILRKHGFSVRTKKVRAQTNEVTKLLIRNGKIRQNSQYSQQIIKDILTIFERGYSEKSKLTSLEGNINYIKCFNPLFAKYLKRMLATTVKNATIALDTKKMQSKIPCRRGRYCKVNIAKSKSRSPRTAA